MKCNLIIFNFQLPLLLIPRSTLNPTSNFVSYLFFQIVYKVLSIYTLYTQESGAIHWRKSSQSTMGRTFEESWFSFLQKPSTVSNPWLTLGTSESSPLYTITLTGFILCSSCEGKHSCGVHECSGSIIPRWHCSTGGPPKHLALSVFLHPFTC